MYLTSLVDETAGDAKILNAITANENCRIDGIFYPNRPQREHLTTRFGLLFYNNKIVIPEAMESSIIGDMLQSQKWTKKQKHSGGRDSTEKPKRYQKTAEFAGLQETTLEHKYRARK